MNENIREQLYELEKKILMPVVRSSVEELDIIINDSFVEYGSSGKIYNKEQTIGALAESRDLKIHIDDFKCVELGNDAVLVTYKAEITMKDGNERRQSLRSSIWQKNDRKWQIFFHQGTNILRN